MTKTVLLKENEFVIEVHPEGIRARNPHKPDNKKFIYLVQMLKMFDDVMREVKQNVNQYINQTEPMAELQTESTPPPGDSPPSPSTCAPHHPASTQQESSPPL